MTRCFSLICVLVIVALLGSACQKQEEAPTPPSAVQPPVAAAPAASDQADTGKDALPVPPIKEDFEGAPQLSLFPRVGDFSPEEDDQEGEALWGTFIDHLVRISGPLKGKNGTAYSIQSLPGINSVGFFAPLAVKPDTLYRVSFRAWTELPEGGIAGAGILEFDEFLWIGYQYPRSLSEKHFKRSQIGVQLTGEHDGTLQNFTFRTGAQTRMVHLVFFHEGESSRDAMVIDDIEIREN